MKTLILLISLFVYSNCFAMGFWHSHHDSYTNNNSNKAQIVDEQPGVDGQDVHPVPEPTIILLLASGLIGLEGIRRKFK